MPDPNRCQRWRKGIIRVGVKECGLNLIRAGKNNRQFLEELGRIHDLAGDGLPDPGLVEVLLFSRYQKVCPALDR